MQNSRRPILQILRQLCAANDIQLRTYCGDFVAELSKNGKRTIVHGCRFEINGAANQSLCDDKSALSEVLTAHDIAVVPHRLVLRSDLTHYLGESATNATVDSLPAVVKPNAGTGGGGVVRAYTKEQLASAISSLLERERAVAVCPFYEVIAEYRVIVLNGSVRLAFSKQRAHVVGDGKHSIAELSGGYAYEGDGSRVPPAGESVLLDWRHNLERGATARNISGAERDEVGELAVRAASAAGIRFASVDVVRCSEGLKVLEINSGVMTDRYASQSADNFAAVKSLYREALQIALDEVLYE